MGQGCGERAVWILERRKRRISGHATHRPPLMALSTKMVPFLRVNRKASWKYAAIFSCCVSASVASMREAKRPCRRL